MADMVQRMMEQMVPELEDLERKGIFNKNEIRSIVKKRTDFEYRLKRRIPEQMDFLRYIQYEMNLDLLRRKRKTKLPESKASISDFAPSRNIHFIYERAIRKFGDDLDLWFQFIEYSVKSGSSKKLGSIFPRALAQHPLQPRLWVKAASWEFEFNNNVSAARVLLQRGLRLNAGARALWIAFFRMELRYIEKLRRRKRVLGLVGGPDRNKGDLQNDQGELGDDELSLGSAAPGLDEKDKVFLSGAMPRAIFKNAIQTAELQADYKFRLQLLSYLPAEEQQDDGVCFAPLVRDVYDSLARDFGDNVECWLARADYALAKSTKQDQATFAIDQARKRKRSQTDRDAPVEVPALAVLEEAVSQFMSADMWHAYASFVNKRVRHHSSRQEENPESSAASVRFLVARLQDVCERAAAADLANVATFQLWADSCLCSGDAGGAQTVCDKGLESFPDSLPLWRLWLHGCTKEYAFTACAERAGRKKRAKSAAKPREQAGFSFKSLLASYEKALAAVAPKQASAIWIDLVSLHVSRCAALASKDDQQCQDAIDACHSCFRRAISACSEDNLKAMYLDWVVSLLSAPSTSAASGATAFARGVKGVREACAWVTKLLPVSVELYGRCIRVEIALRKKSKKKSAGASCPVRAFFEKAVAENGKHSPDLWLWYIADELRQGQLAASSALYWRALKQLKPQYHAEFSEKHQQTQQ